jgi:hypothetical protein
MKRALVCLLLLACSKPTTTDVDAGATTASVSASAPPPVTASASAAPPASASARATTPNPIEPVEAKVTHPKKLDDDRALAAAKEALEKHFGGKLPARLAVQSTELTTGHHRAVLVFDESKPVAESAPFVIVADEDGKTLWTRERPVAGIMPPIGPFAIAAGPKGRVSLAACDPPTSQVAIRLWDEDGAPFADFAAMDMDVCDAVSLLYWPKRGWVVVAAKAGSTRAQLLTDEGTLAWGRGLELAARPKVAWPVTLASDEKDSFVVVQRVPAEQKGAADHVLAFRYDVKAKPLWTQAVDLGETRAPAGERIPIARPRSGLLRVTLGAVDVELTSDGAATRR